MCAASTFFAPEEIAKLSTQPIPPSLGKTSLRFRPSFCA
ncbi:hypothetical protein D049_4019A, partial [Vibrio parahaemolyticus VPTS-2010]